MEGECVYRSDHLDRAIAAFEEGAMSAVVRSFVDLIGSIGDELVPVATGALRASRKAWFTNGGLVGGQSWGGGDVDYAGYVHNGTIYMPARPWAAEAVAQAQRAFKAAVLAHIRGGG